MKKILQLALLAIFIVLLLMAGCNMLESMKESKEEKDIVKTSGRIEGDEYNAGARISGKVEKILVREGDSVNKGDLIGNIFSGQLKANLDAAQKDILLWETRILQAENSLAQAKAQTDAQVNQAMANLNVNGAQMNKAEANRSLSVAELDRTRLLISQAELEYQQARANLKKAEANLSYNEKEYTRYKNLLKEDAIAKTRYDAAETQYITAKEDHVVARRQVDKALKNIESCKKSLNVAEENVNIARAGIYEGASVIEAGKANVNLARVGYYDVEHRQKEVNNANRMLGKAHDARKSALADLEDSKVYAPISGTVVSKIVEPGEVISGGTPLVTIVDMDSLYLRVFLPEQLHGLVKIGNEASITPDAFDGKEKREKRAFKGVVYQISSKYEFTPKNVETKEQRAKLVYSVKIRIIDNKDRALKPGMPCEASINTATQVEKTR